MRKTLLSAGVSVLVGSFLSVIAAGAQSNSPSDPSTTGGPADNDALAEITVTSRRREERLQDVPVSVAALPSAVIEKSGAASFMQMNNLVPNLELNNGRVDGGGSVAQMFIRGVGQEDFEFPMDPGVGLYVDGVYVARSTAGDFGFMDLDRIEVLRGPQGSLYGKNTIGGAVLIETVKPSGGTGGAAKLSFGNYHLVDFEGNYEMPIAKKLWAKVAVMTREEQGYGRSWVTGEELRDTNKKGIRLSLRSPVSEDLDVVLSIDYSRQRQHGAFGSMVAFWPGQVADLINTYDAPTTAALYNLKPPYNVYGPAFVNDVSQTGNFTNATTGSKDNNEIWGTALTINDHLPGVDIKSITAYRNSKIDVLRDGDQTPFQAFAVSVNEGDDQVSEEVQFSGKSFADRLSWVSGLFAMRETGHVHWTAPLAQLVYDNAGVDISLNVRSAIKTTSLAAFGEGTFKITDALSFTVGGRLNQDQKLYDYGLTRLFSGAVVIPAQTLQAKWDNFLPKVGFDYHFTRDIMGYASFSKGFKAGGWNPRALTPAEHPEKFDPEYITTYETGLKTAFWDGRSTLNTAVFFSDYRDIQIVSVTDVVLANGQHVAGTGVNNAGRGRIYGSEIEWTIQPIADLRFTESLGLLDAKYTELSAAVLAIGLTTSSRFIEAPKTTFDTAVDYTVRLKGQDTVELHLDGSYKSTIYRSVQNFAELVTPPYWISNANVEYHFGGTEYAVSAYVTNLANKIYLTNGVNVSGLGVSEGYWSRPREYGLTVKARF